MTVSLAADFTITEHYFLGGVEYLLDLLPSLDRDLFDNFFESASLSFLLPRKFRLLVSELGSTFLVSVPYK